MYATAREKCFENARKEAPAIYSLNDSVAIVYSFFFTAPRFLKFKFIVH